MPLYKGGKAVNWDYCPEGFKTKAEEAESLEKQVKDDPNYILPPRKRQKTKPFNSDTTLSKAALNTAEKKDVKYPVHPRLYNTRSLQNSKKTTAILAHKVYKTGFQYECTFEESTDTMWLCAQDVGDTQIGEYWEDFEDELRGDTEVEQIEDSHPVKDGPVTSHTWQLMKHKANVAIAARNNKMPFKKIALARIDLNEG